MSSNVPSDVADVASPRKRQPLELFRGLPRRYDLLSAIVVTACALVAARL